MRVRERSRVSIQGKHFYLVVLGQAVCVAVGLWMHHWLLRSSAYEAVEESFWSDIEVTAEYVRGGIEEGLPATLSPDADAYEWMQATVEREQPEQCYVTIVDRGWRPVCECSGVSSEQAARLPPGQAISWVPCSDQAADQAGPSRGMLDLPGGAHLAVAHTLQDGAGYLLVHRPVADVEAAVAPFVDGLFPVGLVTLLWTVALLSITVHLVLMRHRETLDRERAQSSADILRQTQMLIRTRDALIIALAKLAGFRDDETGSHLERISAYSVHLASVLRRHPKFSQQVTPEFIRLIRLSSILHDIGKVGIEDSILRKPGKLTPQERQRMQLHTSIAGDCLGEIAQSLGNSNFLEMAREIALGHHERWDGAGYPNGLTGEAIPLSARIVAIADVYDALATRRVYKDTLPHEQCVGIIRDAAGTQFDPDLVETWLTIEGEFREIARRYACSPGQTERSPCCAPGWDTERGQQADRAPCPAVPTDDDLEVPTESSALC